jgi:hypothetical protein
MERAAKSERSGESQAGCRGPRRSKGASRTERAGGARASEASLAGCRGPRHSRLVRKGGFEPPRSCERQPLKLVRLPVPPLSRTRKDELRAAALRLGLGGRGRCRGRRFRLRGAAGGVAGVVSAGAGVVCTGAGPPTPLISEPGPCWPTMPSAIAPTMKSTPSTVVALVRTVAPARAPKAVWLPPPPKALAMSPPLPCCSSTTTRSSRQLRTYRTANR